MLAGPGGAAAWRSGAVRGADTGRSGLAEFSGDSGLVSGNAVQAVAITRGLGPTGVGTWPPRGDSTWRPVLREQW